MNRSRAFVSLLALRNPPRAYRLRPLGLIALLVLGLLSTLATGDGDGGSGAGGVTNTPPRISNLQLSQASADFMEGGGTITIQAQLSYTDPDADLVNVRVEVSDGTSLTLPIPGPLPGSSGTIVGAVTLSTAVSGSFQTEIWVVDRASNESNRLVTPFIVLGSARLTALGISAGELDQIFQPSLSDYTATVSFLRSTTTVTPTTEDPNARIEVNGVETVSATASTKITLNEGDNAIVVTVTAGGGVASETYTLEVTRNAVGNLSQRAYIKAGAVAGDFESFGAAVVLDDDTLAVGAPLDNSSATGIDGDDNDDGAFNAGAVYVFARNESGIWSQQAYIKASNTDAGDWFGEALALDGDTLAVGAPFEDSIAVGIDGDQSDNSGVGAGAAYVFFRDENGAWSQQAYIKGSNTYGGFVGSEQELVEGDFFGSALTLQGDTLAVGAVRQGVTQTPPRGLAATGAVYVFGRSATGLWHEQTYIKASNYDLGTAESSGFGASISLDRGTLAVAAPAEKSGASGVNGDQSDDSAPDAGAVYIFVLDENGAWSQQAYIKASNAQAGDSFGGTIPNCETFHSFRTFGAVTVYADVLAVGAYCENSSATGIDADQTDNSALDSGAVYLFTRDGSGSWVQNGYMKASNTGPGDAFGSSVAVDGETVVVGSPKEESMATGIGGDQSDNSAIASGAVYVFSD